MYGCLPGSRHSMQADIYSQVKVADDTGAVVRSWAFDKEVYCSVIPIESSGRTFAFQEIHGKEYRYGKRLRMTSVNKINTDCRVRNVRDIDDNVVYQENDGEPTWFDIIGSNPAFDAFGNLVEYVYLLDRSEVQYA